MNIRNQLIVWFKILPSKELMSIINLNVTALLSRDSLSRKARDFSIMSPLNL